MTKRPGTIEELHTYCDTLEQTVMAQKRVNEELQAKIQWLEEQFRLAQHRRFGVSSERIHPDQLGLLFNEAEVDASEDVAKEEPTFEEVTYRRRKQKGQRKAKFEDLPVETMTYELPAEDQVCGACEGHLHVMSQQVRKELKIIPAEVRVVEHVQNIYSCRACEKNATETPIVTAPMPATPIPRSLASPSALAHVMVQKYADGMPLYRQEQQFARQGIDLSRQMLANWMLEASERWLTPVYDHLHGHLKDRDILAADETTLQVLREPGREPEAKSFMWLYRTGRDAPAIVLYDYQETRSREHPLAFLEGFSGYLQVDGYAGYERLPNIELAGCWAHARRKFDEALKALPPSMRASSTSAAKQGLAYCNKLFAIERSLQNSTPQQRQAQREAQSRPLLDEIKTWLDTEARQTLPKTALGQAIGYCRNQWDKLIVFLKDGRLELDNNRAERSIKPFVIGRKAWLFCNTPRGARTSALAYSIIETAKENQLNPFRYLEYLFEKLPNIDVKDPTELEELMPWSRTLPNACKLNRGKRP